MGCLPGRAVTMSTPVLRRHRGEVFRYISVHTDVGRIQTPLAWEMHALGIRRQLPQTVLCRQTRDGGPRPLHRRVPTPPQPSLRPRRKRGFTHLPRRLKQKAATTPPPRRGVEPETSHPRRAVVLSGAKPDPARCPSAETHGLRAHEGVTL